MLTNTVQNSDETFVNQRKGEKTKSNQPQLIKLYRFGHVTMMQEFVWLTENWRLCFGECVNSPNSNATLKMHTNKELNSTNLMFNWRWCILWVAPSVEEECGCTDLCFKSHSLLWKACRWEVTGHICYTPLQQVLAHLLLHSAGKKRRARDEHQVSIKTLELLRD